jgi:hypothetical protein
VNKSRITPEPEYFSRYIGLVPEGELESALESSRRQIEGLDLESLRRLDGKRYAPGKWTVKDILQHVTDTERIFCYRALRFARNDATQLPGFDENLFAQHADADRRTLEELIAELTHVRAATDSLFRSFDDTMLLRVGKCWNYDISVLACGFTIVAHQIHHLRVIETLYVPLAA